jgi:hypothetical protein
MSKTINTANTTISFEQYAYNTGSHAATIRENSLSHHLAYKKADETQQRDMRVRYMCHHIQGQMQIIENKRADDAKRAPKLVTLEAATKLREAGKGHGIPEAHVLLIDCAYSDFRYNVVQGRVKGKVASSDDAKVVIPAEVLAHLRAIDELVDTYPEMRAMCNAYIGKASK